MKKFWMASGLTSALLASAITLVSCGGGDEKKAETPKADAGTASSGGAAKTPDEANGATITGKVSFEGEKPKLATLDMSANPVCMRAHPTPPKAEDAVVNDNNTLRYAFVWVKSGLPDGNWQVPSTPVTLDQNGCQYKPHVIGVMAGQTIEVKNSDNTNHNIHPNPTVNQEWNESQPPGTAPLQKSFARQEIMMPVKCNVHNWMRSYISVVSHPFFAVTGEDGSFTIKGLPPGTYTVEVVHEKYGKAEQSVTVAAKDSKTVDFKSSDLKM